MQKPKVLITKQPCIELPSYLTNKYECFINPNEGIMERNKILEAYSDITGLITADTLIDQEFIGAMPKLKVVSNISSGFNNFDLTAMKNAGIIGTRVTDVGNESVSELVIALMLNAARRINELDRFVKKCKWDEMFSENYLGVDLHSKTVGIFGLGQIGFSIAQKAKYAFDMKILYNNRNRNHKAETELNAVFCEKDELLKMSDFIILQLPATKETHHFIAKKEFDLMKKTAVLINTSRGSNLNEKDLYEALKNRTILAAGIDVFEKEPIEKNNPLLLLDNIILLPHIGSSTRQTRENLFRESFKNLFQVMKEENISNRVV